MDKTINPVKDKTLVHTRGENWRPYGSPLPDTCHQLKDETTANEADTERVILDELVATLTPFLRNNIYVTGTIAASGGNLSTETQ